MSIALRRVSTLARHCSTRPLFTRALLCAFATLAMTNVAASGPAAVFIPPAPTRFPVHATHTHRWRPADGASDAPSSRVLIVGDIHGCIDELEALAAAADIQPARGDLIVAAGDIIGKGPESRRVIQYLMRHNYRAVLGNHCLYTIRCAHLAGRFDGTPHPLIDQWTEADFEGPSPRVDITSAEYASQYYAKMNLYDQVGKPKADHAAVAASLSEEELHWLATLPLTLTLKFEPESGAAPVSDILIVHAGVMPGVPVHQQHPLHLTTMRNIIEIEHTENGTTTVELRPEESHKKGSSWSIRLTPTELAAAAALSSAPASGSVASASAASSSSPPLIVFGHDAKRGFQRPNPFRLGLDTGCVVGKQLTGLLLTPTEQRVVHVDAARVYSKRPHWGSPRAPRRDGRTVRWRLARYAPDAASGRSSPDNATGIGGSAPSRRGSDELAS